VQSEVIIIVCDVSDPQFREHLKAVEMVLGQIGAANHERIFVFNKIDKGLEAPQGLLQEAYPNSVMLSAKTGENLDELKKLIEKIMCRNRETVELNVPAGSSLIGEIMKIGKVFSQEWGEGTVKIKAELPNRFLAMLASRHDLNITKIKAKNPAD
jgi:GTP-binding protein HflX